MRDIAVCIQNANKNVTPIQTIHAIKDAGFKYVFIQWYDEDWNCSQKQQVELCKELGLNIIFAHLGYQNINDLWANNSSGDNLVERYKRNIKECKDNGIPMVVIHLVSGKPPILYNEIGLNRIRQIVEYAKEMNVIVTFENTKCTGYLEYVIKNIQSENLGICFDAGHYHAHFNDEFDFEFFKDKIFAVHLHDNDKSDDLHLLPFDGTLDWQATMNHLKESNYNGPITLELCYRYDYLKMSIDEFYKLGYERGLELAKMID